MLPDMNPTFHNVYMSPTLHAAVYKYHLLCANIITNFRTYSISHVGPTLFSPVVETTTESQIFLDAACALGSSDFDIFFEIQYASCVFGLALKS